MTMKSGLLTAALAIVFVSGTLTTRTTAAVATPFFMALPAQVLPYDVGANGWVSVGIRYNAAGMYWMPNSGFVDIGGTAAVAVSRDGQTIVGSALDTQQHEQAAIWSGAKSWRLLGSIAADASACDRNLSASYGASEDGKVIVGLAWNGCKIARAFRWTDATGMVNLGTLNGQSTRANAVSGDGQVVVGWQEDVTGFRMAAKWVGGVEELIKGPTGGMIGEAHAANYSGSLIVGANCTPDKPTASPSAWTWTKDQGVQCFAVDAPRWLTPRPYQAIMEVTSDDGRVIGGAYSFGLDSEALVWIDGQVFFLKDYLRDNGVPDAFTGWVNTGFITGVTPDGRTLVGYGAGPTTFQGYIVVLPDRGKQ